MTLSSGIIVSSNITTLLIVALFSISPSISKSKSLLLLLFSLRYSSLLEIASLPLVFGSGIFNSSSPIIADSILSLLLLLLLLLVFSGSGISSSLLLLVFSGSGISSSLLLLVFSGSGISSSLLDDPLDPPFCFNLGISISSNNSSFSFISSNVKFSIDVINIK